MEGPALLLVIYSNAKGMLGFLTSPPFAFEYSRLMQKVSL